MVRVCRSCSRGFEFDYAGRGRPRAYCFSCQPEGTRMVGAVKTMEDSPDLRPALAYLKAVSAEDHEGIRVLTEHNDLLDLVEGLADLVLLFVGDVTDNPTEHVNQMFKAYELAQGGFRE